MVEWEYKTAGRVLQRAADDVAARIGGLIERYRRRS